MTSEAATTGDTSSVPVDVIRGATVRFVGDSGDGMQLAGTQFTDTSAVFGNDVATLPDYPAEIRAPAGTVAGVSGFQINFSSESIHTPGDRVDALIAMNPAALKINLDDLVDGGILVVNVDEFTPQNLGKAKYEKNPLDDPELKVRYRVFSIPITHQTLEAVSAVGLGRKDAERCKNLYALGLIYWLYERTPDLTVEWIREKFHQKPEIARANTLAIQAGYNFGDTAEIFPLRYRVEPAKLPPGTYRNITGNLAIALGLTASANLAGQGLFYGSYPITPASDILHELAALKHLDVVTFQAEDEIAAMCATIGAAYAGSIAATGTSGPGLALKQEAIGLAVSAELPCVIVNVQRGGPSTGLPTKTEQADLHQAVWGRNGECPVPVIAARSPADCFATAMEACRIAVKYMSPVIVLTDGYVANSSEPWRIPDESELPRFEIVHPHDGARGEFQPFVRNEWGSRPWAIPGQAGFEHHLGGLEKDRSGNISYSPANHQLMINERQAKVDGIVHDIPDQEVEGDVDADLLVIGWGGTYGTIRAACTRVREAGHKVAHAHVRYVVPLPKNLGDLVRRHRRVLVPELNLGQFRAYLQSKYCVELLGLNKVQGRPFAIREVEEGVLAVLKG